MATTEYGQHMLSAAEKRAADKAKKEEGLTQLEKGEAARARSEGRKELFSEGLFGRVEAAEKLAGELAGAGARGTARALAAQGPGGRLGDVATAQTEAEAATKTQEAAALGQAEEAKIAAAEGLEAAGEAIEDISAARNEATLAMNTIIDKHKGLFNDDEAAMYREIMDYLADPMIPEEVRAEFTQKAEDIRTKKWDV